VQIFGIAHGTLEHPPTHTHSTIVDTHTDTSQVALWPTQMRKKPTHRQAVKLEMP